MKKSFKLFAVGAMFLAAALSCTQDPIAPETPGKEDTENTDKPAPGPETGPETGTDGPVVISFTTEKPETVDAATKTVLGANNVVSWSASGEYFTVIQTIDDSEAATSVTSEEAVVTNGKASFKATFEPAEGELFKYNAVYPSSAVAADVNNDATSYKLNAPSVQSPAEAASFAAAADLLVSERKTRTALAADEASMLRFKRIVAVGKITVNGLGSEEAITSIRFTAEGKKLSGQCSVNLASGEVQYDGEDYVEVRYDASANVKNGSTAIFTCFPVSFNAGDKFSVTVTTADTKVYKKDMTVTEDKPIYFLAGRSSRFEVDMAAIPEKTVPVITLQNFQSQLLVLEWSRKDETSHTFGWATDDLNADYTFLFSTSEDMSNPVKFPIENPVRVPDTESSLQKSLTQLELDKVMEDLGMPAYKYGEVYWSVEGKNEAGTAVSAVIGGKMPLYRIDRPFVDPRDQEEYRVCRVFNSDMTEYAVWLADNLRATKYADDTDLVAVDGFTVYFDEQNPIYGGYYCYQTMMKGNAKPAFGEKVQGIAPNGWHIPTGNDWDFLINNCGDSANVGTVLKDAAYWIATDPHPGTNSIGFNLVGAGYGWKNNNPRNDVGEDSYLWASDVDNWGNPLTYGFYANNDGNAYGKWNASLVDGCTHSVRCVLD